jgi:hypothetical protein
MAKREILFGHESQTKKGCIGCCLCEGGARKILRSFVLCTLAIFTYGIGLLVLPFSKKCLYCGHNMFMNKHEHGGEISEREARRL